MTRLSILGGALTAAVLLALTGCSGDDDKKDAEWQSGPGASAAAAADGHCRTADVELKVAPGGSDEDVQRMNLVLTNKSGGECTLAGHPAVTWVSPDKLQINQAFEREPAEKKTTVKLAPGAPAHAVLRLESAENYDEATCKPVDVRGLRVVLPGESSSTVIDLPQKVCSEPGVSIAQVEQFADGPGTVTSGAPAEGDVGS